MRVFLTGGTGVLGRALIPLLTAAGHDTSAPGHGDLDLYDAAAVAEALRDVGAVYHLATRIPSVRDRAEPGAWSENDRLRAEATRVLVDAALVNGVQAFILPSVTFLYPPEGPVDEDTPLAEAANLGSMVAAEAQVGRFAESGRRGLVLRLGLLWGAGTGSDTPVGRYGASLHEADAGSALYAALTLSSGVYNVVSNGQRVSNARFKSATGWTPQH